MRSPGRNTRRRRSPQGTSVGRAMLRRLSGPDRACGRRRRRARSCWRPGRSRVPLRGDVRRTRQRVRIGDEVHQRRARMGEGIFESAAGIGELGADRVRQRVGHHCSSDSRGGRHRPSEVDGSRCSTRGCSVSPASCPEPRSGWSISSGSPASGWCCRGYSSMDWATRQCTRAGRHPVRARHGDVGRDRRDHPGRRRNVRLGHDSGRGQGIKPAGSGRWAHHGPRDEGGTSWAERYGDGVHDQRRYPDRPGRGRRAARAA
jgi:hypothetical protein